MINKNFISKKAQLTTFIILSILVVALIGIFFSLRGNLFGQSIPREIAPVYDYYLSCLTEKTLNGASILGHHGGYIEPIDFSPGNEYMPFSNKLNFLGSGIPYWYYISGGGLVGEQVPTKEKMEFELNKFIKEQARECDFSKFLNEGFIVELSAPNSVETKIMDNKINLKVEQDIMIRYGNYSWISTNHEQDAKSNLGKFYDLAIKIYNHQKETMFLENYAVDILRLYAPVDGSEIGCSPKIWFTEEIRDDLMNAIEANVGLIKVKGDYYKLSKEENKYFIQDIGEKVDANVNFVYSKSFPMKMEVWPSEGGMLKADPVGLQEGMGILGFCYVTYHYVYDLGYPVLVQLSYGDEIFQFPFAVYISKNKPRVALDVEGLPSAVPELCMHKLAKMSVYTYNTNLEPVRANIDYKCFDTTCNIGTTGITKDSSDSVLVAKFPQCANGYMIASAPGYKTKKYIVSTINEGNVQMVLDKKYKLMLQVSGIGGSSGDYSVISFKKDNESVTASYPDQKEIELTEGQYEVETYVYSNSNINLQGTNSQKCVEVPKSGILGAFGLTENKCFNLDIPEQVVSYAVSGGGTSNYYITESELSNSKKIVISPESFGLPSNTDELQLNYNKIETSRLDINFE